MPSLAEIQRGVRRAVVAGEVGDLSSLLIGGGDVTTRLRIHQRHYRASLVDALLAQFPATGWLIGPAALTEAAEAFVREHPPRVVCVAEYGEAFPGYLSDLPAASRTPYLGSFAELELHLGQVSLAVEGALVAVDAVTGLGPAALADAAVIVQPGLRYLYAPWPVDELIRLYLTDTAPEQFELSAADVWVEVRGARGRFTMRRLDAAEFAFRRALADGQSLGEAAEHALDTGLPFDAGASLAGIFAEGLVTTITLLDEENVR